MDVESLPYTGVNRMRFMKTMWGGCENDVDKRIEGMMEEDVDQQLFRVARTGVGVQIKP